MGLLRWETSRNADQHELVFKIIAELRARSTIAKKILVTQMRENLVL